VKRGPNPHPTALRKLRGNPSKTPFNTEEPELPAAPPSFDQVPAVLVDDPVAAAEWRRLAPLLREARVVTEADRNALIAACQQWSVYQDALLQAPAHRRVLRSPNDYPIPNPFVPIANKALVHCERLWDCLGLTPAARTRVAATNRSASDDPFAEFDEQAAARIPRVKAPTTLKGAPSDGSPPRPH
jgi:P27 family predicted phage terminase small subunit